MAMILYVGSKRYSSWSLRAYLALARTQLECETRTVLLYQPDSKANVAKVSPTVRMPVLHHDGLVIQDSLAICEYFAELAPEAKLWPTDRAERARARAISAEMHSGFMALRQNMPFAVLERHPGVGHTPEVLADARRAMTIWREQLAASGGPFLFGAFTLADAMYAPVTTRFTTYGVDVDPTCRAYVDAIAALPAMQAWCADAATEPEKRAEHAT